MHTKGKPSGSQYEPQPPSDQNGYFRRPGYAGTASASAGLNPGLFGAPGPAQFLLHAYFTNIQDALPILPFNEHRWVQTLADLLRECHNGTQLFYASLGNLMHFQTVSPDALAALLHHFLDLCPFESPGLQTS